MALAFRGRKEGYLSELHQRNAPPTPTPTLFSLSLCVCVCSRLNMCKESFMKTYFIEIDRKIYYVCRRVRACAFHPGNLTGRGSEWVTTSEEKQYPGAGNLYPQNNAAYYETVNRCSVSTSIEL